MPPETNMEPLIDADAECVEPTFKLIAASAEYGPISMQESVASVGPFFSMPPQIRSLSLIISPTSPWVLGLGWSAQD